MLGTNRPSASEAPGASGSAMPSIVLLAALLSATLAQLGCGQAVSSEPRPTPPLPDGLVPLRSSLAHDQTPDATPAELAALVAGNTQFSLELLATLPRFTIPGASFSLREALQALGMALPFDADRADFSALADLGAAGENLFIGDVIHQAMVAVDEDGTEAAAATAVIMCGNSVPEVSFTADRPFLFFIRDRATGTLIFTGALVDPAA